MISKNDRKNRTKRLLMNSIALFASAD